MASHCSLHSIHYSHKMNVSGIKQKMKLCHLTSTLLLASLFTAIKAVCDTELDALDACTGTDMVCRACAVNAPYFGVGSSCDDLQVVYCTAVDTCLVDDTCGACVDQMEILVGCILNDYNSILGGCDFITCGTDPTNEPPADSPTVPTSGRTSVGSFTTIMLSLASLLWV